MLELEVVPEHGLISDVVEFILGKSFVKSFSLTFRKFKYTCLVKQRGAPQTLFCTKGHLSSKGIVLLKLEIFLVDKEKKVEFKDDCFQFDEIFPGMHFSQAVATIQSLVGSVKGVQILYSDKV